MQILPLRAALMGLLIAAPNGCEPRPISEEPNQQEERELEVDRDEVRDGAETESGVDVNVGGGDGVDVDVDPGRPGTDVDVGDEG